MPQPFIHKANVTNAVKNIVEHYPLVDGPIRELLQNSDDAGATKQIFVLDRRQHSISSLASTEYIASQQSPALIAYNDGYFGDDDWGSLQSIFDSSKANDPSAFGQFGQGFRCVYHLTDCPQIFSGDKLAFLSLPDGTMLDMTDPSDARYASHIAAFGGLPNIPCYPILPAPTTTTNPSYTFPVTNPTQSNPKGKGRPQGPYMQGTAIRLPLRSRPSVLSTKCHKPEDILKLFDEFTQHELECALLFLKNVREIAMYEVTSDGNIREICSAVIHDRGMVPGDGDGSTDNGGGTTEGGNNYRTWKSVVETRVYAPNPQVPGLHYPGPGTNSATTHGRATGTKVTQTKTTWRRLYCPFTDENSEKILGQLSKEHSPEEEMKRRKLRQTVRLAAPLSIITSTCDSPSGIVSASSSAPSAPAGNSTTNTSYGVKHWRSGRLFSGLPLPRINNRNWPIHVDAHFAIPPSRQFVRSSHEGGFIGEWNTILFTAFIPQAWTFLLHVLAQRDRVNDIFAYWPPPGPANDHMSPFAHAGTTRVGGSSTGPSRGNTRSQGMLQIVFDLINVAKAAVWPVYVPFTPPISNPQPPPTSISFAFNKTSLDQSHLISTLVSSHTPTMPQFADLGTLKVAREDIHLDLGNTLAECGVKFTKPPGHFKILIEGCSNEKLEFLDPKNVYEDLVANVSRLEKVISDTEKHAANLLDFLLKGQDILLLSGLPVLKNIEGQYIILERLRQNSLKQTLHTLFDTHSSPLFKTYDSNAIGLQDLKHIAAGFIWKNAPGVLNVAELTAEKVADYLSADTRWTSPTYLSPTSVPARYSSPIPTETMQWLLRFYLWVADQPFASQILRTLEERQLYLIPTQLGLRRVGSIVFDPTGINPTLGKCLRALSVPLLDPVVVQATRKLSLSVGKLLRKVEDVADVLECVGTEPLAELTCMEWREFLDHITRYTNAEQRLTQDQTKKLRSLPIFPIISYAHTAPPRSAPGPIPEGRLIYAVTSVEILPIIDGCVILDFRGWPSRLYEIIRLLDPSLTHNIQPLTPIELLRRGIQNFESQPPEHRSSIINYAAINEKNVPRECIDTLLMKPFVTCRLDGTPRKPGEVVDPASRSMLSVIISTCVGTEKGPTSFDVYLPRMETASDKEIIESLRKFQVSPFMTTLDQPLTLCIASWISNNITHPAAVYISKTLFKVLASNPLYAEFAAAIPSDMKWIATNSGLRDRLHCRDRNSRSAIFDEVYALVDDEVQVTDALRNCLGWAEKMSLDELFSQLDATLRKGSDYARVRGIIQLIGADAIPDPDISRLHKILENRPWVPTRAGRLVKAQNAVLSCGINEAGIFEVSFDGVADPHVISLLKRIGIDERPTTNAILTRLEELASSSLTSDQVGHIIKLLGALPDELDKESTARISVPDVDCIMRRIPQLYFNDTGTSIHHLPTGQKAIAHGLLPEQLARKFGIEPLAKHYSKFSGYMGESFVTSIRNTITEYTETQTLVEMLANAVDANAKRFVIILDEMHQSTEHLISPRLRRFQQCPALLIFNDASFTEEDFDGLCNTGEGSKKRKDNAIGQFGRGALTMFHFTECPALVSHKNAMFIDPTRMYLSDLPPNANNQRVEVQQLQKFYPGHLSFLTSLASLLGFDGSNVESFSGTIFRLPLRMTNHVQNVSDVTWSLLEIQEKIIPPFKELARDCFLFTGLECIEAYVRNPGGDLQELWSYKAKRTGVEMDGEFERCMIEITEGELDRQLWQTASWTVLENSIPPFALTLVDQQRTRRFKYPKVALAAYIRPPGADYQDYHRSTHLFSTLPLTEPTSLPVYCSAKFITSSDRRHVRLQVDDDPGNQAQYNEWLLKDLVPPVYLYLLEVLLATGVPNHHFWPVNRRTPADKIVIDALYEQHLQNTNRCLFQSAFNPQRRLTPKEVHILNSGSIIQPIIEFLSPHNVAIYSEPFLSCVTDDAQLPPVSPRLLREHILIEPVRFLSGFRSTTDGPPQLSMHDLSNLLAFFLEHDPDGLIDLPLLPLEDGEFGTFYSEPAPITYYVWRHQLVPNNIFANSNHLVMLNFDADIFLNRGFNIEALSSPSLAALIAERFPKQSSVDISQDPGAQQFIKDFWANFELLQLMVDDILEFPLVPKYLTNEYISLKSCRIGDIPIIPSRVDQLACQCLVNLGVPMVQMSSPDFPPPLVGILNNRDFFHQFRMKDILQGLENIEPEVLDDSFFNHISDSDREAFSDWIRRQLFMDVPAHLQRVAKSLPVWTACDNTATYDYIPASELILLPQALDVAIVARFITGDQKIVLISQDQNDILRPVLKTKLGINELSFDALLRVVSSNLPTTMSDRNERLSYKQLIESILERIEGSPDALLELKLPNAANYTLQPVKEFYAREDSLFRAAYPETSDKFICQEFHDMEGRLPHLKWTQDLTMEMFEDCVRCIADARNEDGAITAFNVLNDHLPLLLSRLGPNAHRWELIQNIRFIPKKNGPLWRGGDMVNDGTGNSNALEVSGFQQAPSSLLVAPRDVVRKEYEAVAWSQRAIPAVNLTEGLIRAYPALGRPTVDEVIAHLRILSLVARHHPGHPAVLSDIVATYRYLNEKADECRAQLAALRVEPLFLNVDNPQEPWVWHSAAEISFDRWDVGIFKSVRRFLHGYRLLLVAAGAQEVNLPAHRVVAPITPRSGTLPYIRRKFAEMRERNLLVDVSFRAGDHEGKPPIVGHRSFLATHSDRFMSMFCNDNLIHVDIPNYSVSCVSLVLEYVYTGTVLASATLNDLLDGLFLAKEWEIVDLIEALQSSIIEGHWVNPHTLNQIEDVAIRGEFNGLARYCREYRGGNNEYIDRVRG